MRGGDAVHDARGIRSLMLGDGQEAEVVCGWKMESATICCAVQLLEPNDKVLPSASAVKK